jgi:hypothetical protein
MMRVLPDQGGNFVGSGGEIAKGTGTECREPLKQLP